MEEAARPVCILRLRLLLRNGGRVRLCLCVLAYCTQFSSRVLSMHRKLRSKIAWMLSVLCGRLSDWGKAA